MEPTVSDRLSLILLVYALAIPPVAADFKAGLDAYEKGDFAGARREWTPLAEQGMAEAQYNLGLIHQHGKGLAADAAVAFDWYLRAAEGGYLRARYRVAEMYEAGLGTRQDLIQAHLWYNLAGQERYLDSRKRRKRVAKKLTPEQLALADMLARHRRRDAKLQAED